MIPSRLIFNDIAKKFVLLCLGVFLFLLFFYRGIETEDVWLHLSIGQWIVHHAQVPPVDEFPFAHERTSYICHEWLASSILYLVFKTGGFTALKLFRSLFFMLSLGIFFGFSYRRLPFPFLISLILLMSYALFQRCLLRPDTFNILFIQLFLISLFSYERSPARWKLLILPFISILWLNLHMMGAFIYGGSIIFIFLLSSWMRCFVQKKEDSLAAHKKQVKALNLTFLVFLATFVINPYGIEGLLFPYKVLLFPQYYGFYKMISITGELQSPLYIFSSFNYFYYILLMVFPILLLLLNRKANFTLNFLFSLSLIAFFCMSRNSSFFALIAAYTIVLAAQNMGFTEKWAKIRWSALADAIILTVVTFIFIIQAFALFNERVYFNGRKHRALFLDTNPYVTSTINMLKDNGIQGPVFNCTLLGGVIIWYDYPQLRPFDDGRHLDYQRFNDDISVLLNPQKNWQRLEKAYDFKIVILSEGYDLEKGVIKYLGSQNDWQLIVVNGPFVVYVKRGAFRLPDQLDKFEQRLKSDTLTDHDTRHLRMMVQRKQRTVLEKFLNPSPLKVDLFSNGVTLMNLGYNGPAAKDFIEAFKISDQLYMQEIAGAFLTQLK